MKAKKCPTCQSNEFVVRIVYGEPTLKTMEEFESGKVHIGGCLIPIPSHKWYCKRDEIEF